MTEKEYRSHPAISRSELWRIHESPEKFKWFREHPPEPTPAFVFGQAVHKLLLERDDFETEFAVAPNVDRRTKDGKAQWEAFMGQAVGKTVIGLDDFEKAVMMVEKVTGTPITARLLNGRHEVPFFWTDEETGEQCKCRTDILTVVGGNPVIVDYKTTTDARTDIFNNHIYKYGYHLQAAMYTEGVMHAEGMAERPEFWFIVQEKTAPFSLNVIIVPPDVMLAGLDTYRELLGIYHQCKEMDYWYSYMGPLGEPNEAYLPGWMQMGVEEDEK